MATVRILSDTAYTHEEMGFQHLPKGLALEVDDDVARRWVRKRIAEPWDGPLGQVTDAEADASVGDLEAEIRRLTGLVDRARAKYAPAPAREEDGALDLRAPQDFLAGYDLTEQQRTNLKRAGFTRREHLDNATLEDLQEVDGIGPATIARLRPDLAAKR